MRALLIVALLLACAAASVLAQDASDCEAPLAELRSQLSGVQAKLKAAEDSGNRCTQKASSLEEKLQQAEASLATSTQSASELQMKLAAAEAALKEAPDVSIVEAERRQLQADAKAAAELLAGTRQKLESTEVELKAAQAELAQAKGELEAQKAEVAALKRSSEDTRAAAASCQSKQADLAAVAQQAERRVEQFRKEAAAAKAQLAALEGAWLPPWAAANAAATLAKAAELAKLYTVEGSKAAQQAWESHGRPAFEKGVAFAQEKATQVDAVIEAKAGEHWPKLKSAVGATLAAVTRHAKHAYAAAERAALAVWHSEAVARVRPALVAASQQAAATARRVQAELEDLLIRLLAKSNNTAPLARRPYVTYLVYAALVVPLVAFGVPLLGAGRSKKSGVRSNGGAPLSTKKTKKKGKGQ